ncbi:DUF91 domain-containing protein [Kangiella profundi]|uniref:DUF91 domain-containing protein n=1 Tax=Kangiella profundi TaxID=1561924 RepID=A0A2K9A2U2_9GAMM|nr:endonuclease NucS domain-containing protein [Kangiella profundi]AUD78185.1 DUF91 domain-containing protein [Kangiella profundi]GGF05803.1 hypothetical protein GCM10011356_19210 [Kangiella profundi]
MASVYEKPVRVLIHEMVHEFDMNSQSIISRVNIRSWFSKNYPKIKNGTISAHLLRMSVNAKSRVHHPVKPGEDDLFYQIDTSHFRLYNPQSDPHPIYPGNNNNNEDNEEMDDVTEEVSQEFAYEKDLQNYLSKNLHLIEQGLILYEEEDIKGIEFPAGGRFIDILAKDKNGNFVVIELKVSKGYDRVVGQLLRYMAWIKQNQAESGQLVRGVIVARNISGDLRLACTQVPDIQLYEYELSVSLKQA